MEAPPDGLEQALNDEHFSAGDPALDKSDLISYYGCAVWYSFYRYGWLYIHERYLTFEAPWMMFGKFVIRYEEMASIKREEYSLRISDRNGEELVLYLLRNPEETYATLNHLWKLWISRLAMQAELEIEPLYKHEERVNYRVKSLHGVSDVLSKHRQFKKGFSEHSKNSLAISSAAEAATSSAPTSALAPSGVLHKSASTESVPMESPRETTPEASPKTTPRSSLSLSPSASLAHLGISSPNSSVPHTPALLPLPAPPATSSLKYLLDASIQTTLFLATFRLPPSESVLHISSARLWYIQAYVKGTLYISPRFICFHAPAMQLKLILPLFTVKSFSEPEAIPSTPDNGITIQTDTGEIMFAFEPNTAPSPRVLWNKLKAVLACLDPSLNLSILSDASAQLKVGWNEGEVFKRITCAQFGPNYLAQQKKLEKKWWKYFASHGIGTALIQRSELLEKLLTQGGIPDTMRGSAWKLLSGVTNKALADPKMNYAQVVATVKIDERPSQADRVIVEHHIELDLRRSMPEHPYYQCDQGIDSLRRVLTAYAFRNPLVSYCQGMNFIASSLLLYMSEEDAFWTLAYLCEDCFPELWRPRLFGVRVVQEVMEQLLTERFPEFVANCTDYAPTLALLTWIPTFLVGRVPLEYSLRMLDHIFLYGADALYWVLYSTFELMIQDHGAKNASDLILSFAAGTQSYLDTATHPFERIFQHAFTKEMRTQTLPPTMLRRLESECKMRLVHELLSKARKTKIDALATITKGALSNNELEMLYTKYHKMLNQQSTDFGMLSFERFSAFYSSTFPMWHPSVRLFKSFQSKMIEIISKNGHAEEEDATKRNLEQENASSSAGGILSGSIIQEDYSRPQQQSKNEQKESDNLLQEEGYDDNESVTTVLVPAQPPTVHPTSPYPPTPTSVSISSPPAIKSESTLHTRPESPILVASTSASSISSARSNGSTSAALNWNFVRDLFKIFDTNDDGYLSIEEWICGIVSLFKTPGQDALRLCLRLVDVEGNAENISANSHRCAISLFLLLFVLRSENGDSVEASATLATPEKVSEWLSIISARASSQHRSPHRIDDIVACSFGDVLNIYTFFQLQPSEPWKNFLKSFNKLSSP